MSLIEIIGAALGISGAFLVALRSDYYRACGFSVWLVSNIFLIIWSITIEAWAMLAMFTCYFGTTTLGLIITIRAIQIGRPK